MRRRTDRHTDTQLAHDLCVFGNILTRNSQTKYPAKHETVFVKERIGIEHENNKYPMNMEN